MVTALHNLARQSGAKGERSRMPEDHRTLPDALLSSAPRSSFASGCAFACVPRHITQLVRVPASSSAQQEVSYEFPGPR